MAKDFSKAIAAIIAMFWITLGAVGAAEMVDQTFNPGGEGANQVVEHVLEAPDGKILICGLFERYNGVSRPWIARLHSDGSLDASFNPAPNYWVRHMAIQPDGKIVIAGQFSSVEGVSRNLIARLNDDGTLDRTFDPGRGLEVMIAPDIYNNTNTFVIWCDLQPDGKILAVGNFRQYNGESSVGIVRINPDGTRDRTFNVGSGFDSWGRSTLVLPNKQILVTGWFTSYNGRPFNRLVRLNENGSADTTLNAFYGDKTSVYSVVALPDGKLVTAGHSLNEQGLFKREIVRLNANGSVDSTWPGKTNEKTECLLLQPDGKLIAVGYFWSVNDAPRLGTARFNADGTLDPAFVADCNSFVWTVAPARDQRILISGDFTTVNGITCGRVARLNLPERIPTGEVILQARRAADGKVRCSIMTVEGKSYVLQEKTDITETNWLSRRAVGGTGGEITLLEEEAQDQRFYRVEVRSL